MYFIFNVDEVIRYMNNTFSSLLPLIYLVLGVWLGIFLIRLIVNAFSKQTSGG